MLECNFFSFVTCLIETYNVNGVKLETGTGFFYQKDKDNVWLFTNWHIITGREIDNPKNSNVGSAIPYKIKFYLHKKIERDGGLIYFNTKTCYTFDHIINDESGNNPNWYEHSVLKNKVDVVALKIRIEDMKDAIFNTLKDNKDIDNDYIPEIGNNVFIIGYPLGLSGGTRVLPIWKSGIISSEPSIKHNSLPKLLIDSRTFSGMSGSPVIAVSSGDYLSNNGDRKFILGSVLNFLGIYSGRLFITDGQRQEISDIGTVWKKEVLDDIVNNGVIGTKYDEIMNNLSIPASSA